MSLPPPLLRRCPSEGETERCGRLDVTVGLALSGVTHIHHYLSHALPAATLSSDSSCDSALSECRVAGSGTTSPDFAIIAFCNRARSTNLFRASDRLHFTSSPATLPFESPKSFKLHQLFDSTTSYSNLTPPLSSPSPLPPPPSRLPAWLTGNQSRVARRPGLYDVTW